VSFILQKNSGGSVGSDSAQDQSDGVSEQTVKRLIAESLRELARSMGAE
jgi:hypothetical protein